MEELLKQILTEVSDIKDGQKRTEERFDKMDQRLERMEAWQEKADQRFANIETWQEKADQRFANIEAWQEKADQRFANIETWQDDANLRFKTMEKELVNLGAGQLRLEKGQMEIKEEIRFAKHNQALILYDLTSVKSSLSENFKELQKRQL
ncbi:phage shock protein A [Cytobacillus eiseniae]|uniref:Phage shock protein A n=1 Tax=Cytobacillus eiseniae TaxID=762947 RepID=A0ABS4RIF4_9BACI|nr:hypothetical protein [Cytobacillus eiseniae]MBP2242130.1 phage shock protein A [Cytobacillus eiseniae]